MFATVRNSSRRNKGRFSGALVTMCALTTINKNLFYLAKPTELSPKVNMSPSSNVMPSSPADIVIGSN